MRWALPALLLLGACSSPAATPPAGPAPSGEVALAAAAAQGYSAMAPTARDAEAQRLSAAVERSLVTLSGLEQELGGPAAADAAYAAVSRALVSGLQRSTQDPSFGRFGGAVHAADEPSIGGQMFGNLVTAYLGIEAAVAATNDVAPGKEVGQKTDSPVTEPATSSFEFSGTTAEAKLEARSEVTTNGVTGKLTTTVTVAPCPDPKGQFTSTTKKTAVVGSKGGRAGSNLTIDVVVKRTVDDEAHLVSSDLDVRTQAASFAGGKGQFADQTIGWTDTAGTSSGFRGTLNRTGGQVTDAFVDDYRRWGTLTAVMVRDKVLQAAQKGWESGRCVAVKTTTTPAKRTGLEPSTSLELLAAPRSKVDGAPAGGTVSATMNGSTSVTPSGSKVKADAKFTVVAPGEKDQRATVALEARSRRGVAKAEVAVDTRAGSYTASGKAGNLSFSGTVADLTKPFTLKAAGGATVAFSYTPTSADGRKGTMRYTGSVAGYTLSGSGTYTVAGDEGGVLTLTQSGKNCSAGPLGCIGGAARVTLTPEG